MKSVGDHLVFVNNCLLSFVVCLLCVASTAYSQAKVAIAPANLVDKIQPSDEALGCIVNLNGHAINYDPVRWAHVPFVTDLSVFVDTTANPEGQFHSIESRAKSVNRDILIGRYLSGGRVQSIFKQFPEEAVNAKDLPTASLRPGTDRVNLDNTETAKAFAACLVMRFREHPRPILFLDNIVHPSALSGWFSWDKTCRLLSAVKSEINKDNAILITNVAVASWAMSDVDIDKLAESVDGVAFEMPFHASARKSAKNTARQIEVYRRLLDQKKIVVLIPVPDSSMKTSAQKDNEARVIAAFAMMVRRPGDCIYIAWPFFRMPEDWSSWPAVLGEPNGEFQIDNQIVRRPFMHAGLTLDIPNSHAFTTHLGD